LPLIEAEGFHDYKIVYIDPSLKDVFSLPHRVASELPTMRETCRSADMTHALARECANSQIFH
jgi:hypothetical protein